MATCYSCGNDYDKAFSVTTSDGETYHFDSFECAIHKLAPSCAACPNHRANCSIGSPASSLSSSPAARYCLRMRAGS